MSKELSNDELEAKINAMTIFDKIEFSGISKESIAAKIKNLKECQIPQRTVLLNVKDEELTLYWFKNWLHPQLKHIVPPSLRSINRGCSQLVLNRKHKRAMLRLYENSFDYTLLDIEEYVAK